MGESRRAPIDRDKLAIYGLDDENLGPIEGFSSGDADLDDFLRSDARRYEAHRLARTFIAKYEGPIVGYVALTADAVRLTSSERKKLKTVDGLDRLAHDDVPVIPAIKVARLAVCENFRSSNGGVGRELMRVAGIIALRVSRDVGCRLITVDAYPQSVAFYEALGFVRNKRTDDEPDESRPPKYPSYRLDLFAPEVWRWLVE